MVTIFPDIYSDNPQYITVDEALDRIKTGASKKKIDEIREVIDKERADTLKRQLPCVCFSGTFKADRKDDSLIAHSGFIVLDFDNVVNIRDKQTELINYSFVYACWVSPRGNGLKALVKIAKPAKHREHFDSLREVFPDVDKSGVNPSRVCYESYDPDIYINENAISYVKIKTVQKVEIKKALDNQQQIFNNILKWLANKGDAFVTGERNDFIFKLASACCRFGIDEYDCFHLCNAAFLSFDNTFQVTEAERTIKSAYKANSSKANTAHFEYDTLVDRVTRQEVTIDVTIFDPTIRPRDVVFGQDVKADALNIYKNGYPYVQEFGIPVLDEHYKMKRGEVTLLSGIGNYGKSEWYKYMLLLRVVKYSEKFATFSPEDNPPEEYYHGFVEVLLGCDCTPRNSRRPGIEVYKAAYDFVSAHIFYVYPKNIAPTPDYIKERFLELIIKEKIDGVGIDPFNQMTNDYNKSGGRSDKYLETLLADFGRFAQVNNVFFIIIAHPHKMVKQANGNYPCPDVFDLADGAMWNNKMDNILIFHRPLMQTTPDDTACEFYTKKIRRQKIVGKRGMVLFEYIRSRRRYFFEGRDYLQMLLNDRKLTFDYQQADLF